MIEESVVSSRGAFVALLDWDIVIGELILPFRPVVDEAVALVDVSGVENVLVLVLVLELVVVIGASGIVATGVVCPLFDVSTVVSGETLLVWEVVDGESVVLAIAVIGDVVAAEVLVADSTRVAVRIVLVWEVVFRASVVPKIVVFGDAVDVSTLLLVVSTLVEGGTLLVWKVVIGKPDESVTVVADVFDVAVLVDATTYVVEDSVDVSRLVDVTTKVSGVAVLALDVVVIVSFVVLTGVGASGIVV